MDEVVGVMKPASRASLGWLLQKSAFSSILSVLFSRRFAYGIVTEEENSKALERSRREG
jgi:hypothetical protein